MRMCLLVAQQMLHQPPSPGHAGDGGVVAHLVPQATGHVVE